MAKYNTGNPLGSKSPKDLSDNAQNLDDAVNDLGKDTWLDRFGKIRVTLSGYGRMFSLFMAQSAARFQQFMTGAVSQFEQFLLSSGYQDLGDYQPGLQITERNQIFWKDGELYRAGASLPLPYVTTGDWASESASFVAVGDAALRQDLGSAADGAGAELVGFRPGGSLAAGRTVQKKLEENLSAADFGAAGNEAGDDSAAFSKIEAVHTGQHVDLLGRVYVVDAIPEGNDYFNGAFKVGADVFWQDERPRTMLFDGARASVEVLRTRLGVYRQIVMVIPAADGNSVNVVHTEQKNHGIDVGKSVKVYNSQDLGSSKTPLTLDRVLYKDPAYNLGPFSSGPMGNGRHGMIFARTTATGADQNPIFVYTDDRGQTVGTVEVSFGSWGLTRSFFHSKLVPWLAAEGGHDTMGYKAYAYTASRGIVDYGTRDNGATWLEPVEIVKRSVHDPASEVAGISETSVVRVGKRKLWIMVGRTGVDQAFCSVSTDQQSWTPAKLIPNVNLRSNPPELVYHGGKVYFFGFSRSGDKEMQPFASNALMVSVGDPDEILASGGRHGWGNWKRLTNLKFWPTGYMYPVKLRGEWNIYFTGGEDLAGGSTGRTGLLYRLSNDIPQTSNVKEDQAQIPRPNMLPTGSLLDWPSGTTISATTERRPVIPGLTFARASFVGGATVTQTRGDKGPFGMSVDRADGAAATQSIVLIATLTTEDSLQFRGEQMQVSLRARCKPGFSAAGRALLVRARQTDVGNQVITTANGFFAGDKPVASNHTSIVLTENWNDFEVSINAIDKTAQQLMLRLEYAPEGVASNDGFEFELLNIRPGKEETPFVIEDINTVRAWADRFVQVKTYATVNGSIWVPFTTQMHRVPSVTLTAGTASQVTRDGFLLTHTAAGTTTATINGSI